MDHYVSRGCQTLIQGLAHDPALRPQPLMSSQQPTIAGTPTPPDDMALLDKIHQDLPSSPPPQFPQTPDTHTNTSMLLKRNKRPLLVARISTPGPATMIEEDPRSPPPTEALMSPLPAANKLHAGHTPIEPRARSPLQPLRSDPASPGGDDGGDDVGLSGPLMLPSQPGDGADDTIPLHVLDQELEKLRIAQEREDSAEPDESLPDHEDDAAASPSRLPVHAAKKENRRSPPEEVVDGVILKKPRMNMGAPLGQA